jgi:type II secretory pathway pseudopilin PulG
MTRPAPPPADQGSGRTNRWPQDESRFVIARLRHQWSCVSSQQGSLLVEVMVGALVLGITTLAVLTGLDGAQDSGARNKSRSEYSALAQQDIERLRSQPITALSNYNETRTVRVGNVDYTVTSETEWVRDASGVVSCTDDNTQAEYMKVSSTVTSPNDTQQTPTKETTLLTPAPGAFSATSGTAAVLLTDRDANPLPGVGVALSGPGSFSDTTNSLGCAIFGYIPSGTYSAQVSSGVTWASQLPASAPVTVNAGRTSLTAIEVEEPASLRAHFKSPSGANTEWSRITVAHAKLPAGFLNFPDDSATTPVSSIDAGDLFPHQDGYGVYAGSCELNNPAVWDSDYYQPGGLGYIELDPADDLKSVDVLMPSLRMSVTKTTSVARRVRVTVTQIDAPECTEKLVDTTVAPNTSALVEISLSLPFGRYRVCVDDGVNRKTSSSFSASTSTPQHHNLTPGQALDVTDPVDMTNSTGRVSGTCPA